MKNDFGRYIDHTLLRPTATADEIRQLCKEAVEYGMFGVCIFPWYVSEAKNALKGARVKIAAVIAFPFGVTFTDAKEAEMRMSASQGADEVDVVINIAALKTGQERHVETEMQRLTDRAQTLGVRTKFIIETAYLSEEEKLLACRIANRVRPDFLKTSTGYGPSGASELDVRLLRTNLLPEIKVKAAGGIRSYAEASRLIEAGASRIGASLGVNIVQEARKSEA